MITGMRGISQFSKREIDYAFKHARRLIKTSSIIILCAPKQTQYGRILVIASRKTGNAVVRNKFKRRLKNIFYQEKLYQGAFDFICIAKQKASLDFKTLHSLLIQVYTQCVSTPFQPL